MHLKLCGKEACDRRKERTKHDTYNQRQNDPSHQGHGRKVKDMTKHSSRIDSLMHNDGGRRHTHTNHTSNGKVRTSKQDQTRYAKCKEHTRRRLLQDIQYIVVSQQRRILYDRRNNTQRNKNQYNRNIQTVLQ